MLCWLSWAEGDRRYGVERWVLRILAVTSAAVAVEETIIAVPRLIALVAK